MEYPQSSWLAAYWYSNPLCHNFLGNTHIPCNVLFDKVILQKDYVCRVLSWGSFWVLNTHQNYMYPHFNWPWVQWTLCIDLSQAGSNFSYWYLEVLQYIPRNMHTVFALLCFVVVIHWLIFPYLSGLLHWHCGNLTIAPVPAKQPWWIWINTSCEFIMNDCITTTKQSTTKPCAYFLGYTVDQLVTTLQGRSPYSTWTVLLHAITF